MLSIGKLSAGQAKYYLDQAQGRVDAVESIGDGVEEYYVGGTEARGEWFGASAGELGLAGQVRGAELRAVLAGLDPLGGSALRSSSSPTRVAGYDLTFSAPKSVSVLFGIGDARMREEVREAHDSAMRAAVGYLERSAAAVRRGHGGAVVEESSGLVAAAFRHRTSRAGDPQLHTHVLVANLGRGVDGRWSALDGRWLYSQARTASFVYQAVLRVELTRRLCVEWTPVRKGIAEVVGVRRQVLKGFSRRRAEIEAALADRETSGARAAEAAALATRAPKDKAASADELVAEWRKRALELGLGPQDLARVVGRSQSRAPTSEHWDRAFDELAGSHGLTRKTPTFTRDAVLQALCEALPAGAAATVEQLEAAASRFLASDHVVALIPDAEGAGGGGFRRRDGRIVPVDRHALRYTTREQLQLERWVIESAAGTRGGVAGLADGRQTAEAIRAEPSLSSEQREVVQRLCRDGDGVAVVAGRAGTGKTFALGVARDAWQAAGHPVLGVATARRAAAELREGAGIESTTVFALLAEFRRSGRELPHDCVLVVDEAGMVPTREIAELTERVLAAGGKLVLVGDARQLPELEAGGTFRALVARGLAVDLTENLRQRHPWERRALDHLREGPVEPALAAYERHGRIVIGNDDAATRERLVADWWDAKNPTSAVMIAPRRADVADLNQRARECMHATGALGAEVETPAGAFAVGDVVVVKRNDLRRGINNGDRAHVVAVDAGRTSLVIETGSGRVRLDRRWLAEPTHSGDPPLMHGYAITGHIAQGLTVDASFVLAGTGLDREWMYVAMSRGRESNRLYVAAEPDDDRAEYAPRGARPEAMQRLAQQLRVSRAQVLAIDSGTPAAPAPPAGRRRWWSPGRGQDDARRSGAVVQRERAEGEHGALAMDTEAQFRKAADRAEERHAERMTERLLSRERGIGRER